MVTVGNPRIQAEQIHSCRQDKALFESLCLLRTNPPKPLELGLAYISVESGNKAASEIFDSLSGLRGPPDTKVLKGRESQFEVGFAVADRKDVMMEVALHRDVVRPTALYST
jgi:hypothetical protein